MARQSERVVLLGGVLLGLTASGAIAFALAQYYAVDALSSLVNLPQDCDVDWGVHLGRHCFSDYPVTAGEGIRANPWEPGWLPAAGQNVPGDAASAAAAAEVRRSLVNNYPAAGLVPHTFIWRIGEWFGSPRLGLLLALLVLLIAVLTAAFWAARGARGLDRVVVFLACGAATFPALLVIDRGNSVGLAAPVLLVFLIALCRRHWRLVAIMVVLAALVKPQFAVLAAVLFAARQWRFGAAAVAGVVLSNLAAYLLWPRDFPGTIVQSISTILGSDSSYSFAEWSNVSFANGLLAIPEAIAMAVTGHPIPDHVVDGPGRLVGYVVLVVVVAAVVALGRRISPVMAGVALTATAALFPAVTYRYYLVFVLPIAALVARDPDGPPGRGLFDGLAARADGRRAVGICVTLSTVLSIVWIALPHPQGQWLLRAQMGATGVVGTTTIVPTTALLAPLAWLITCGVIIVSYARRPVPHQFAVSDDLVGTEPPGRP
ncbi:hypothetical protein CG716_28840 [Mycolicibacterium sphagni]|uniref:DUF2029 domain-containing protein n=1 Tax=Mycolicibacterium sphagni TaxID=1786 RepID=A0A255DBR7_9MYCO|nr:hypothetical protein CG716_28840 [Mycolicibacterium sphagni]